MRLKELLKDVPVLETSNDADPEITSLAFRPEDVQDGCLYFAISEFVHHDGKMYDSGLLLNEAVCSKIKCVVHQNPLSIPSPFDPKGGLRGISLPDIVFVKVADSRKAMSLVSSNFHGNPERKLTLVGVTGTNGKTTTANLIRHILDGNGRKTAVIGTLGSKWGNREIPPSFTTPLAPELYGLFRTMIDDGVTHCVMEVSSHSLELDRVYGLKFPVKVFTNLTRDHIDFHGNLEGYKLSKMKLFRESTKDEVAVCNFDDPLSREIVGCFQGKTITYGFGDGAACRLLSYGLDNFESRIQIQYSGKEIVLKSRLLARFNAMNSVAAFIAALELGVPVSDASRVLASFETVPGRFEKIVAPKGYLVIIDYAHTPDALENIVRSCRDLTERKLITVFGCGGDRDRGKRPIMGDIALKYSDYTVVTSDNPRTEPPQQILNDIVVNYPAEGLTYSIIEDRKTAIHIALEMAEQGDIVVIAGKGHEDYQIIGREKIHFSDRETVEEFLKQ